MTTLSIDAMGGDNGLDVTVPAAFDVLKAHQDVELILVGNRDQIAAGINRHRDRRNCIDDRITIQHAAEVVTMDESPTSAVRKKKDSSMRVAINLVKEGVSDGCISSGNTGALLAVARFVLKTIPGINRPAICAPLPRRDGQTYMLDLGANVDTPPQILLQFGIMGSQLVRCLNGNANPSVGLLNIGVEEMKGSDMIKSTAELFKKSQLNYSGFVEADEIYLGKTDLIVCDGVLGNVALKASEGVAQMIMSVIKEEFTRNIITRGAGLLATPGLKAIKTRLDHRRFNGASFLGLRGTVVKSHGGTDRLGFRHAIGVAIEEVENNLVEQIQFALAETLH